MGPVMERHGQHMKVTADDQEIVLDSDRGAAGRADAAVRVSDFACKFGCAGILRTTRNRIHSLLTFSYQLVIASPH